MGGVRNFGHYAADTIITFLSRRQVTVWFILDRDERDQAEVRKLEQRLGAKAHAEILDRREIENFLIVPGPLEAFIRSKQEMAANKALPKPTKELIITAIDECADDLKGLAIEKQVVKASCHPIYPKLPPDEEKTTPLNDRLTNEFKKVRAHLDSVIATLPQQVEDQTRIVGESWQARKLEIVPGDILLDRVCERFGVRFKKGIDGPRLAALMTESDIDGQIKRIIRDLGSA